MLQYSTQCYSAIIKLSECACVVLIRARHVTRFNQLACKLVSLFAASFTKPLSDYQVNALRINHLHPCSIHGQLRLPNSSLSPSPSLQTTVVQALHVDLTLADHPFMAAYFSTGIVPLLAVSIDCFCKVQAQRCKESQFFDSGQMASDDLSGRTHARTHGQL